MSVYNSRIKEIKQYKYIVKLKNDETYVPSGTIINKYIIIGDKVLKFSRGLEEVL